MDRSRCACDRLRGGAGRRGRDRDLECTVAAPRCRPAAAPDAAPRLRARARARCADAARCRCGDERRLHDGLVLVGARGRVRGVGGQRRTRRALRHGRRRHLCVPGDPTHCPALRRPDDHGCARDRVPRDRRPGPAGAAPRDARRQRADDGALVGGRLIPARRMGDRPLVADGRLAGGDPARVERRRAGVPLGREGNGDVARVLRAGGLRRDRAAVGIRARIADRRRSEPRQPPVGRGRPHDPHRQPPGRRKAGQSRLPGVFRQRLQRDARARPVRLGGDPRGVGVVAGEATRHPAPRSPRRDLSAVARNDVRDRARPDRLRRAHRHDEGTARRVRDVLEL